MQLKQLTIKKLFGYLDHHIGFPVPSESRSAPALVILHGRNGVGKTTLLRMLDGILRLDFNPFRAVPFSSCRLEFDSGDAILVEAKNDGQLTGLIVSFKDARVELSPEKPGPKNRRDEAKVEEFRRSFFAQTEDLAFEFIDTERLQQVQPQDTSDEVARLLSSREHRFSMAHRNVWNPKARNSERFRSLAERVLRFIREAQVNYRTFFSTTEPDLFPRILEKLTSSEAPTYKPADLRSRLMLIHQQDQSTKRLGLEADRWDLKQFVSQIEALSRKRGPKRAQALAVVGSYVELLESRAAERLLVADRLFAFERLMAEFFSDKTVAIDPRMGLAIKTKQNKSLEEKFLSSGEYHLLFLMVAALVTRRRGTVIAIDEPEMSMHLAWQRKLIPALLECSSKAEPLLILATHSPDLAVAYPEALIELS